MPKDIAQLVSTLGVAVRRGIAIRRLTRLIPAGGAGDKLFPPTYLDHEHGRQRSVYATETRMINGESVECVLLDSVQSQANRLEQALLNAYEDGQLLIPLLATEINGVGKITSLEAPHRVYDAIFRDSSIDQVAFRESRLGQQILAARPRTATALYTYCPNVLLFGGWDSHAGNGGRGARFARALTSEIIGLHTKIGVRTAGRVDPLGIGREAGPIFRAAKANEQWTLDENDAKRNKRGPETYGEGRPANIGHGNIPPSLELGGVTVEEAHQTAVLSLAQLHRLRFPEPPTGKVSKARDTAGRMVLAALGLYALTLQIEQGFDLRSRCLLLPVEAPKFEILGKRHGQVEQLELDASTALDVLKQALQQAEAQGLVWAHEPVMLKAQPKLEALIQRTLDPDVQST